MATLTIDVLQRTTAEVERRTPAHRSTLGPIPSVDVLVCGSIDRGDDGAPSAASELLESDRPANAQIRRIGRVDVDNLLSIPRGAGVVIVDAATGVDPGTILELPLRGLLVDASVQPRSSHSLAMPEVIGLADMLRGRPLVGRIVVIGARRFTLGRPLTRRVSAALPSLSRAVRVAIGHVTETLLAQDDEAGLRGQLRSAADSLVGSSMSTRRAHRCDPLVLGLRSADTLRSERLGSVSSDGSAPLIGEI
jgi:hydrogenase maturation protease